MGQVSALRKMYEMLVGVEEKVKALKGGVEGMRRQMEDRVAPVCSDVACACSQALERRGGNRVFALHVRARTI